MDERAPNQPPSQTENKEIYGLTQLIYGLTQLTAQIRRHAPRNLRGARAEYNRHRKNNMVRTDASIQEA
jgi:hypothetical protein